METTSPVDALRRPEVYRTEREQLFPSPGSFAWYTRQHRQQLESAGALIRVGGRLFVHQDRFDAFVLNGNRPG